MPTLVTILNILLLNTVIF